MNNSTTATVKRTNPISPREQEILHLIAHEKTSKEIASELYISTETVLSHRRNIMHKMNVRNVAGMVRVGMEKGLVGMFVLLILFLVTNVHAQINTVIEMPVSINEAGAAPEASAVLDINSTTQGILIPRMTTCLLYTSPSPRDRTRSRMPSSA